MEQATLVSVEEYLRTNYDPDVDYVDGVLEDRSVGDVDHASVQGEIPIYLRLRYGRQKFKAIPEARVRINATRYRIPDLCAFDGPLPGPGIIDSIPFACIEVLSPEDRLSRIRKRLDDFLARGVPNVWLIDPEVRREWICTNDGKTEVHGHVLHSSDGRLELDLHEIYAAIDEMRS